jgi:hypothetical protein
MQVIHTQAASIMDGCASVIGKQVLVQHTDFVSDICNHPFSLLSWLQNVSDFILHPTFFKGSSAVLAYHLFVREHFMPSSEQYFSHCTTNQPTLTLIKGQEADKPLKRRLQD